jgi:hypothetical protein
MICLLLQAIKPSDHFGGVAPCAARTNLILNSDARECRRAGGSPINDWYSHREILLRGVHATKSALM